MTSVPQSETSDPIPITIATIKLLARMRALQGRYRVRQEGPKIPRLRLMESDLDKALESLPHDLRPHEMVVLLPAEVEHIRRMRELQRYVLKTRDADRRELREAEKAVDAMLCACPLSQVLRIDTSDRPPVMAGGAQEEDEDERPGGWMPYKDN